MNTKKIITICIAIIIIAIIVCGIINVYHNNEIKKELNKTKITIDEGNVTHIKTITYPDGNFRQFNNNSELIATSFPNETVKLKEVIQDE